MRDILNRITKWWEAGESFGLATVVRTYRSAPRDPGAALAVASSADHEVVGSVSGGCVEGAVYDLSLDVCQTGDAVLETYGVSDDDAFAVGLTCGGIIDIFVERIDRTRFPELGDIAEAVERGEPVAVATVISGPGRIGARRVIWASESAQLEGWHAGASGTLGTARLDAAVDDDVRGMLAQGLTGIRRYGEHGERRGDELSVFVNSFAPAPRMLVFGAIDFAAAVARVGKFLGYHVTVCDARKVFATASRFPDADEVVVDWPHRFLAATDVDARTVICVLTHDPKFDVPLLEVALRTPAGYIGAMGSRRTHDDRLARLREVGLTEDDARGGAAHPGRVHRRDGQPPHARRPAGPAPRGRPHRGRTGPAALADRAGPRGQDSGGDRGVDRRRADPAPLGRHRPPADLHRGPDPPPVRSASSGGTKP